MSMNQPKTYADAPFFMVQRTCMKVSYAIFVWFFVLALCSQASAEKITIGKLGQTLESTEIHRTPSSKSGIYYRAKAYEYIVVNPSTRDEWLKVVMSNGSTGYILTDKVARLPYAVTVDKMTFAKSAPSRQTEMASLSSRGAVAQYSLNYLGTPYKWGGENLKSGIDCSGFVKALYGKIGINLPRTAAEQARVGEKITRLEDLQPGDRLYFWDSKRGKIGHTGMYLGNGYFVHASSGQGKVSTSFLDTPYWRAKLVDARR